MRLASTTLVLLAAMACSGCVLRPQAHFELHPSVVSACHLPVATQVSWDVSPLGLTRARVEVYNLGRRPKLWLIGASRGTKQAGAWAHDGYTVVLKAMNGVELARRTLTTEPCVAKKPGKAMPRRS